MVLRDWCKNESYFFERNFNMKNIKDTVRKDFRNSTSIGQFQVNILENFTNIIPSAAELVGVNDYYEIWVTSTSVYYQYNPHLIREQTKNSVVVYSSKKFSYSEIYGVLRGGITERLRDSLLLASAVGIHASMVFKDKKFKLFIGAKGSGKTSVALNLVNQGYTLLTDEFLTINSAGTINWLYRSPGVYEKDIENFFPFARKFGWLESKSIANDENKLLLDFSNFENDLNANIFEDVDIYFLTSITDPSSDKKNFIDALHSQIISGSDTYKSQSQILDYLFDKMIISNVHELNKEG